MITGNKGEWSELYTLFKILSEKKIYAGDKDLNKIADLFFPIIKVLRDETNTSFSFEYENDIIVISENGNESKIPIGDFHEKALELLEIIKAANTSSFSAEIIEEFIDKYNSKSLKAKSSVKSDIKIVIHDLRTGMMPELGFSIKSQLGNASTLLNAGKTTNFIYKIVNCDLTKEKVLDINSIDTNSKIKDRIDSITKIGGKFQYIKTENDVFGNNLLLIDSGLPIIISDLLFAYYTTSNSKISDLLFDVKNKNPLKFNTEAHHPFYEYKTKRLLSDIALGMMPSTVWTGSLDATGGYLIVKEDGDVVCYHIYNRNDFEEYLLNNTKLETASSSRHRFGHIYTYNDEHYIKLNLQIRFIK